MSVNTTWALSSSAESRTRLFSLTHLRTNSHTTHFRVKPHHSLASPAAMLAYRQPADHFAPQASSSRAALPQQAQPPPRTLHAHAVQPTRYDAPASSKHAPVVFPTFSSAPLAGAPPAPPPAQPTSAQTQQAAAAASKPRKTTSKLTEQWGTPPDQIKRDDEWLERGAMLGEVGGGSLTQHNHDHHSR